MKKIILFLAFSVFLSVRCSKEENPPANSQLTDIQESFLPFALNILGEVRENEENNKNICISPLSIEIALMMTMNGADGETLDQIRNTLGMQNFSVPEINASYQEMEQLLTDSEPVDMNLANAIFWDPARLNLFMEFKDSLEYYYGADLKSEDFSDPSTVDIINAWADDKTEGRITEILNSINQDEAMFLINALYIIADWEKPFPIESTENRDFTLRNGNKIQVPTMWQDAMFNHYEGVDYSAVDLNFENNVFSMSFILPPKEQKVEDLLGTFRNDPSALQDLFDTKLTEGRAIVILPKFELKYHKEIKTVLADLGMPRAFNELQAQFPNFGEAGGNIFLSRVLHDTFLKIDEKGAEGAAVTTVGVGVTSVPPTLDFNRPFLFILRHKDTDAVIFAGILENPVEAN